MTNLNEVASLDWKVDMVSSNAAVGGSGIVNRLTSAIHRIWDILDADWGKAITGATGARMEGQDADYYPSGGCCCV